MLQKILKTNPIVFLDIFKAIVVFTTATGILTVDDATQQTLFGVAGGSITLLLSLFNRDKVYSMATHERIVNNLNRQLNIQSGRLYKKVEE